MSSPTGFGAGIGTIPVEPAIYGTWPFGSYPDVVSVNGTTFRKAVWAWPYPSVVAQYRQDVATDAMHLMVYRDGSFVIEHMDEISPDPSSAGPGSPLEHAVVDAPLATAIAAGVVSFGLGLVGGLLLLPRAAP
jgi:hypothetical protein